VCGGFSDVYDRCMKTIGAATHSGECTLWPAIAPDNSINLVGTWDTHASGQASLVVVRRQPDAGVETLALSTAGWPMQQGITSNGLAFAIANMGATTRLNGTSYICALPRIVCATSSRDAAEVASGILLCSARYYAFVDCYGVFVGTETDGRKYWRTEERVAHTNHFVFTEAKLFEGRPHLVADSERRRQAATNYLDSRSRNPRELLSLLAFNDGTSASISRYGEGREDRTCAAFVLDPVRRSIIFTVGPPALSKPIEIQFNCLGALG
jgi:hypothetical protein